MLIILVQELRRTVGSFVTYTVAMLTIFGSFLTFFSTFQADAALLDQLLQNFPVEFRAAFGFADVDLATIAGYLSFLMSYIVLIGAVFGMKLGVSLLSEESRRKTSDFLLSRPVRRDEIFGAKLLTVLIWIVGQNLLLYGLGQIAIWAILRERMDPGLFAALCFVTLLVQLFFVGLGQLIAVLASRIKGVMAITLGVVFFFFIIELVNQSLNDVKLSYFTPFSYFKGSSILANRGYEPVYLALDLSVFLVLTGVSFLIYRRKDIRAV